MSQSGDAQGENPSKTREFKDELLSRARANWVAGIICATLVIILGVLMLFFPQIGDTPSHWSYDLPFRVRGVMFPTNAGLIYMDEISHKDLGQRFGMPWDRKLHAKLLDKLTEEHAAGVVFDVVFTDPSIDPKEDAVFAEAIKRNGHVILAADYRTAGYGTAQAQNSFEFDPPCDVLYDACDGKLGSDFVYADTDEEIRRHLPTDPHNDQFSSEGWEAASMLDAPITHNITNKVRVFYINYYGPSGVSIPSASFSKVLSGEIPSNYFTGKVVFVGERLETKFSGERKDQYPTPFSYLQPDTPFSAGMEVQATAFLNILRDDRLFRLAPLPELILVVGCGFLVGFGFILLRPMAAAIAAVIFAFCVAAVNYVMFVHFKTWFAWEIVDVFQIPIALVYSISVNSVQLYVEKQKVEQSLALYLSPKLVKQFAKNPKLLKPGAEKQLLTILFSDIAGFTTISEGMDSDHLALAMNNYFQSAVQNCIFATDGTVVKYIGDAIFAFWNAPEAQGDHSLRACEAALKFRDQPAQFMNKKELITRIGLHTGVANVGNFGSMTRVDYTALGENINLASRMEGLNKYLGTRVLITGETQKAAGPKIVTRFLGLFRLKGFEKAVSVYELTGRIEEEAKTRALRERFAAALELFAQRDFIGAVAEFKKVLEIAPNDGPTEFYLEQIEELHTEVLPGDWKGEITLKDK